MPGVALKGLIRPLRVHWKHTPPVSLKVNWDLGGWKNLVQFWPFWLSWLVLLLSP